MQKALKTAVVRKSDGIYYFAYSNICRKTKVEPFKNEEVPTEKGLLVNNS